MRLLCLWCHPLLSCCVVLCYGWILVVAAVVIFYSCGAVVVFFFIVHCVSVGDVILIRFFCLSAAIVVLFSFVFKSDLAGPRPLRDDPLRGLAVIRGCQQYGGGELLLLSSPSERAWALEAPEAGPGAVP